MTTDRINLYLVTSESCITLSQVPAGGIPRLFDPSDIYIYRCSGKLLVSRDGGSTYINIIPDGIGSVNVISQTVISASGITGLNTVTHVVGRGSSSYLAKYQNAPEISTWTTGGAPPAGFVPSDAAADLVGDIGILIGNSHSGTESRIVGAFDGVPFTLVDSDAGIPQTTPNIALITDIEICE
jgi:hypothetical protein